MASLEKEIQAKGVNPIRDDTIAAVATPLGEGGLAVLRISGPAALTIAERVFVPAFPRTGLPSRAPSHTLHYGRVVRDGRVIDEVMLAVMRAPRTFTGEDSIEITCHGGVLPTKLILDALLSNGARLARPGEFTQRAFLNGRLDLAQAEAVGDLIHARTELALSAANEQLAGRLSRRIETLREQLMRTLAHIEAHIDFPEEDIAPDTREELLKRLGDALASMDQLLATADEGQILRRGVRAAIVGRPNAGKSSLLNQLLGRERAIVSPIAGTTRDTIEETANIRGLPIVFVDTAGLREAQDEIEVAGIRRSHEALDRADLILHVLDATDASSLPQHDDLKLAAQTKRILVRNKVDLLPEKPLPLPGNFSVVDVSCVTGFGLEPLKDAIKNLVWAGQIGSESLEVMINSRHQDALRRAREATARTMEALRGDLSLELVALDLHIAVGAVGEVVGKTSTEDLLDSVFSQFCIGK